MATLYSILAGHLLLIFLGTTFYEPLFTNTSKRWYSLFKALYAYVFKLLEPMAPLRVHELRSISGCYSTDMRHLTTGIRSEKCVVRRFRRCANVYLHKPG